MFDQFNLLLTQWSRWIADNNPIVESIIQFGSTCKQPIKKETDVDILYIIDHPRRLDRFEAYAVTKDWDADLERKLKTFKNYNFIVNSHTKSIIQLDHLSPMYLDFLTEGKILFDRKRNAADLFTNIERWIIRTGARRIQKGQLWYWIYDDKDPHWPVDFKF